MPQIVHLITGLNAGGAELALLHLLEGLTPAERLSHRVVCMITPGVVAPRIEALGVPVVSLGMAPGRISLRGLGALLTYLRSLPDWRLQGWMYHADLLASLAACLLLHPKRHIWSIHNGLDGLDHEKKLTRLVIRLLAGLSFLPARIVYVGQRIRLQHEALGYRRSISVIIPNGVDISAYHPGSSSVRAALGLPAEIALVGFIGRFDAVKNPAGFLAALARLNGVHGLMAGAGMQPDNAALNALIRQHGLEGRVHLLGYRTDVPDVMRALDVLCMCSHSEAGPLVVAEAMACGVPCVATDVGDAAYMLAGHGWVVPPRETNALIVGIQQALAATDKAARGTAASQRVAEEFTWQANIIRWRQVYADLGWLPD